MNIAVEVVLLDLMYYSWFVSGASKVGVHKLNGRTRESWFEVLLVAWSCR